MEPGIISEQGLRGSMEDAYSLDLDFGRQGWIFGGVYDGHRGKYAAGYAAKNLHHCLLEQLDQEQDPKQAFIKTYLEIAQEIRDQESGTTAVTFLLQENLLTVANAGDSRALLINYTGPIQLTVDHRLDNPHEYQRIKNLGTSIAYPYVYQGQQGLMTTRSLGDQTFKSAGVIAEPFVQSQNITPEDRFLIAACDGLFDHMNNQEVHELAQRHDNPKELAWSLRQEVLMNRMGTDNLTIIIISLQD